MRVVAAARADGDRQRVVDHAWTCPSLDTPVTQTSRPAGTRSVTFLQVVAGGAGRA